MTATEQQLNEELRASEERLSFILESAGLGTWDWNLVSDSLVWSQRCLEMFGIPAGTEMSYERFLQALHPDDRERVDRAVKRTLAEGQDYSVEMRTVWPDGSLRWVASRGRAYFDQSGRPLRMSGAALDITRLKRTEEALQQARAEAKVQAENLAAVLDAVPALTFFTSDRDCRTMAAGRLAREVFDLPESIYNVSMSTPEGRQLGFTWLEDGRELTPEELPLQAAAAAGREVRNKQLQVRFPDGKLLDVFGHAVPLFDAGGAVRGAVAALLDITALKKTEAELQQARAEAKSYADNMAAIFDAVPAAAFFSHDRKCRRVTSNRAAYELLRMPYGSNLSKSVALEEQPNFRIFENGRELRAEELPLQKAALTGKQVRDKELEVRFEDGSSIYEFGHAVPLFDEEGEVRGAIGAFLDITDRKVIEERLRAATERFRVALRGTPITVFNQDAGLRYRWVHNPGAEHHAMRIIGKRDRELLERHEDWEMMERIKNQVLRTGVSYQGEMTVSMQGELCTYHVKLDPQRDPQGRIIGVTGATYDLTDIRRAEAEHEKISRQRQLALDAAKMAWWHYDDLTQECTWDESFKEILGVTTNSLSRDEILGRVHPEDLVRMAGEFTAAFLDETAPQPHFGEYRIIAPDGSLRWVEVYAAAEFRTPDGARRFASCSGTVRDVTQRKATELALRESEARHRELAANLDVQVQARTQELQKRNKDLAHTAEQVRLLTGRLLQLQDDERRRIARELHDSSGQILTAIGLDLANLAEQVQDEKIRQAVPHTVQRVEETQKLVQMLHKELRTTSYLLHPPLLDEAGLSSAISWYVQGLAERSGMEIKFNLSENFGRLARELELVVFRVLQESLTNILRHSESKRAFVRITRGRDAVRMLIEDYGKGISAEKLAAVQSGESGFGIRAMRERLRPFGGELQITSNGSGTQVLVTIPQSPNSESEASEPVQTAS
jgi:PAS domain S-box-containing protein